MRKAIFALVAGAAVMGITQETQADNFYIQGRHFYRSGQVNVTPWGIQGYSTGTGGFQQFNYTPTVNPYMYLNQSISQGVYGTGAYGAQFYGPYNPAGSRPMFQYMPGFGF